jgi:NAD(P)-dependent dehydrogenase (short-subunit alcohol dehydrogenase family)
MNASAAPVALVTGGSGGIGHACANVLAARGYDVVLTARRADRLEAAAKELGARWVAGDATEEADAERIVATAGEVALLVCASGILEGTFIRNQPVEVFDRVLRANLRSAYLITQSTLTRMTQRGRIIYVSSTAGLKGMKGLTAYSSAKAGMNALAQSVAAEVERDGIAVHLVTPAPVRTAMIDPTQGPTMWLLEPEDVASAVGWLETLPPRVVVREVVMRSVATGPFAPEPVGSRRALSGSGGQRS